MALFSKDKNLGPLGTALLSIQTAIESNELSAPKSVVRDMLGFESIDGNAQDQVIATEAEARRILIDNVGFDEVLKDHLGVESVEDVCVQNGIDAAVATMMAAVDPEAYHQTFTHPKKAGDGVQMVRNLGEEEFSMEGFDNFQFKNFLGTSVVANALAAASSPLSETFFRTVVLAPSQNGLDVSITDPRVYNHRGRNSDGTEYDYMAKSVVRAVLDHTILENNATKIIPAVRTGGETDGVLVPNADVPTRTVTLGGQAVKTRPIAYGKKVDLLAVSAHEGLLTAEVQDETDTLDPSINLGTQYVRITNDIKSAVFALDIANIPGSLLTRVSEGKQKDMTALFDGALFLSNDSNSIAKTTAEAELEIATILGVSASEPWKVELKFDVTAKVEYTPGNMIVRFNEMSIGRVYTGADNDIMDSESTEYQNLVSKLAFEGLGYEPNATRSNSNMRNNGTVIEVGEPLTMRIAVSMQSPLSIIAPVSVDGGTATMDAVNMVKRVRASNQAVTEIFKFRDELSATKGILYGSSAIGSMVGIKPTYIKEEIDVKDQTVIFGSSRSLDELTGALSAAVTMQANRMLLDSGYLASLEMFTGSTANFEIIIGTDPLLASLLMKSGDNRTLGNGRNYKIASSQDERLRNKIFMSVRRTDVDGADPHSFGVHPTMPSLIHTANTTRSGSVRSETILVPRESWRVTTPVLVELDVVGMENIFVTK